MRSTLIAAVLTAGLVALVAPAAGATEPGPYTPDTHTPPSLAGSTASALCVGDVPWINYSVELTDPDKQATNDFATLVFSNGTESVEVKLGKLDKGALKGSVLWPGATIDADGNPTGWPGWAEVDGVWTAIGDDNFGWTRSATSAELRVNPELTVPISYPPASAACASPTAVESEGPAALAMTGGQLPYLAVGIGSTALLAGIGAVLLRRRRAQR